MKTNILEAKLAAKTQETLDIILEIERIAVLGDALRPAFWRGLGFSLRRRLASRARLTCLTGGSGGFPGTWTCSHHELLHLHLGCRRNS